MVLSFICCSGFRFVRGPVILLFALFVGRTCLPAHGGIRWVGAPLPTKAGRQGSTALHAIRILPARHFPRAGLAVARALSSARCTLSASSPAHPAQKAALGHFAVRPICGGQADRRRVGRPPPVPSRLSGPFSPSGSDSRTSAQSSDPLRPLRALALPDTAPPTRFPSRLR